MGKSPLILAALAKAAVPSLNIKTVRPLHGAQTGSFDSAALTCTDGSEYIIRIPKSTSSALELDVETAVLRTLDSGIRSRLPFAVARIVGETLDSAKTRAVVFDYLYGSEVALDNLMSNSPTLASIGNSLAAIHSLNPEIVRSAGLPEYSAADVAKRRMAELDNAAMTGLVPKALLERWQDALENVSLFQYVPTVVHGEMTESNVLEQGDAVSAIFNWGAMHIGDPAEDFTWIAGKRNFDLLEAARTAYAQVTRVNDSGLSLRAVLYSELSHARWLLHGQKLGDQAIIDEATADLEVLALELNDGLLPKLSSTSFAQLTNAQSAFVAEPFVAETVVQTVDSTGSIETIDQVVVVGGLPSTSIGDIETSEPQEPSAEFVDDRTREIELPEKTDNELF